jgi:hypothetical protein
MPINQMIFQCGGKVVDGSIVITHSKFEISVSHLQIHNAKLRTPEWAWDGTTKLLACIRGGEQAALVPILARTHISAGTDDYGLFPH